MLAAEALRLSAEATTVAPWAWWAEEKLMRLLCKSVAVLVLAVLAIQFILIPILDKVA